MRQCRERGTMRLIVPTPDGFRSRRLAMTSPAAATATAAATAASSAASSTGVNIDTYRRVFADTEYTFAFSSTSFFLRCGLFSYLNCNLLSSCNLFLTQLLCYEQSSN